MFPYKKVWKSIVQNLTFVEGQNLRDIALPTDYPISRINIRLSGTPTGTTVAPGTLQNPHWPALCNALGLISIEGTPLDGSKGVQVKNVPAGALWLRSWMMLGVQPRVTDLTVGAIATACNVNVPLIFMDPRLPKREQLLTALEAPRYASANGQGLVLKIQTGNLQETTGALVDQVAIVGGTYTAPAAGTLVVDVSVEQLVPLKGAFPSFNAAGAIPFLDLNLGYQALPALSQANSNGVTLMGRGLQVETFWLDSDRDANQIETPVNNLGVTPTPRLEEKLGTQQVQTFDPNQMQDQDLEEFLPAATSWPDGVYITNDNDNDLAMTYELYTQAATHSWDLNMGASSLVDSVVRQLQVTYEVSRKARQEMKL